MKSFNPRWSRLTLIVAAVALCAIGFYPQSTGATRLSAIVLSLAAAVTVSLELGRTLVGKIVLGILFLVSAFLTLGPGRQFDQEKLKGQYIVELRRYLGTAYVWGGENRFGIDCSGLVRSALINASLREGLISLNPRLVRSALSLWWYDRTARQLGEGFRQDTASLAKGRSIHELDETALAKGDLAVTHDGVHVLAYCGNGEWIEADPVLHKVISASVRENTNPWLLVPVVHVRWDLLRNPR